MISQEEYDKYIQSQADKSQRTTGRTVRYESRRLWLHQRMQEFGAVGKTMLCVGARHSSEVEFFEDRGYEVDGIDLFNSDKIIKCDMSKMLEHPYIGKKKYDVVFANEVMEHCLDLDGFVKGLNEVCKEYFVVLGPSSDDKEEVIRLEWWDVAVHKFMINTGDSDEYSKNLLDTFREFDIVVNEKYPSKRRLFFILKRKSNNE